MIHRESKKYQATSTYIEWIDTVQSRKSGHSKNAVNKNVLLEEGLFVLCYLWCKVKFSQGLGRVGRPLSPHHLPTLRALPPANLGETVSDCDKSDKTDLGR